MTLLGLRIPSPHWTQKTYFVNAAGIRVLESKGVFEAMFPSFLLQTQAQCGEQVGPGRSKAVAQVGTVLGLECFWTLLPLAAPRSTVIILRVTFWGGARKAWVPA